MSSLNQVTLLGRVGGEPKTSTSGNGTSIARFSLATSRKYQDKEETQWHNIVCFSKAADFAGKYVHKGDCVVVIGEIKYEKFTNKDNKEVFVTSILATNIQLCSSKNKETCEKHTDVGDDLPGDDF